MIFGTKNRVIVPAVVQNAKKNKAHWIYFVIDTGAPITYLPTHVNTFIYGNGMLLLTWL